MKKKNLNIEDKGKCHIYKMADSVLGLATVLVAVWQKPLDVVPNSAPNCSKITVNPSLSRHMASLNYARCQLLTENVSHGKKALF